MKIPLDCMKCKNETGVSCTWFFLMEFQDDGAYVFTCPSGHEIEVCLQQHKFEILFAIASHAILDGYYREAIASFMSALEQFYELYVNVVCLKHKILQPEFEKVWGVISKNSERYLGAYICARLLDGKEPTILSEKDKNFRNAVIHKGKIPTKKEAIQFGETVFDLIHTVVDELQVESPKLFHRASVAHMHKAKKKFKDPTFSTTLFLSMLVQFLTVTSGEITFAKYLERLEQIRLKGG